MISGQSGYGAWRQITIRLPWWRIALIVALAAAIGIAIAIVATGVFLIALPVVVVTAVAYRLFGGKWRRRAADRTAPGQAIDAEYEVIDDGRRRS